MSLLHRCLAGLLCCAVFAGGTAASLAAAGPEHTDMRITSVPGFVGDDHCITVEGGGAKAVVDIYSDKSAIAGWSLVALLRNLASPLELH